MKNPYELRYEIYQQASQKLMDRYFQDNGLWQDYVLWKRDIEEDGGKVTTPPPVPERPIMPTHEEILVEAEKIYEFVQRQ